MHLIMHLVHLSQVYILMYILFHLSVFLGHCLQPTFVYELV